MAMARTTDTAQTRIVDEQASTPTATPRRTESVERASIEQTTSNEGPQVAPPHAAMLDLQGAAGNRAVASAFDALAGQVKMTSIDYSFPLAEGEAAPGIKVKPKLTFKGEFGARYGHADTKVSGSAGGVKLEPGKASMSIAKAELEEKFAHGMKLKGALDATPSGVTPSVEFSGPVGLEGLSLRVEYAPWKVKHDMETGGSVSLSPLTLGLSKPFEFAGETLYFKGTVELSAEASLDPKTAIKFLAERYGTAAEEETLALGAAEAGIVIAAVGGALLVGLDIVDEDRRAQLAQRTLGRARSVVAAESVYLTELEGRATTPHNPAEQLAQDEARSAREKLAAKLAMEGTLLSHILAERPTALVPFRWRDAVLDELERTVHRELDAYADAHPLRTLWGLRMSDDKKTVTQIIDSVREGGDLPQIRGG